MLNPIKNVIYTPFFITTNNSIYITRNREQSLIQMTLFVSISMITNKMKCKTRNFQTCKSCIFSIYRPFNFNFLKMAYKQIINSSIFFIKSKLSNSLSFITYTSTFFLHCNTLRTLCCDFHFCFRHNLIKFIKYNR